VRLTKLEKEMLRRCADMILAGEWPWQEGQTGKRAERAYEREKAALESAARKMTQQSSGDTSRE
jgi:hypothetical protein